MTKEEFITERTRIISEMLDNPEEIEKTAVTISESVKPKLTAQEQAFFIAEPQGGVTMQVQGRNNNKISIGAYDDTIAFDMKLDTNNENLI